MDPDVYFLRRNKSPPQLRDIGPDSSSSLSPNCPDLSFQLLTPALVTPGQTCHLLWTPWCINLKPQHVWAIASILRYVSKIKRVIKHRKHGYWGVEWWVFRGPGAASTNFVRKWFFREPPMASSPPCSWDPHRWIHFSPGTESDGRWRVSPELLIWLSIYCQRFKHVDPILQKFPCSLCFKETSWYGYTNRGFFRFLLNSLICG